MGVCILIYKFTIILRPDKVKKLILLLMVIFLKNSVNKVIDLSNTSLEHKLNHKQ